MAKSAETVQKEHHVLIGVVRETAWIDRRIEGDHE